MGQKEKLIEKLKAKPKTFTFDDAEALLRYFSYKRSNKGRTAARGSCSSATHTPRSCSTSPTPGRSFWSIRSNSS